MSGEGPTSSATAGTDPSGSTTASETAPGSQDFPAAVLAVDELTPERFGVRGSDANRPLRPYFPRESDAALRAALTSGAQAVLVSAEPTGGAIRSTYEVLREVFAGQHVLLLDRLSLREKGPGSLDRLLASGADVVWAGGLRRVVEEQTTLLAWFRKRRKQVAAPVVAMFSPGDERLLDSLGTGDFRIVPYAARLTTRERDEARRVFGRDLTTVVELAAAVPAPAELPLAAFRADTTGGRLLGAADDDLDIRRDVEMLAKLIASADVHPPLSIGLFGRWGSGKSFLMRQIRLKIAELAADSQGRVTSTRKPEAVGYHRAIVPVEFNAWQYVKGEGLWASLINRVFECIREFGEQNPEYQASLAAMATQAQQVEAAQANVVAAREKVQQTVGAGGESRTVADVVGAHRDLTAEADAVARALNTTKDQLPVSAVREEVTRLGGSVSKLAEGWRLARSRRRWQAALLLLGGLLVGLVLATAQVLPDVGRVVAAGLAWSATATSVALTVIKPANALLVQATRLLGGHDRDRAAYLAAEQQLSDATAELERLRRGDVAQLYDFVNERYQAEEYRRALGMTPIIREDLRRLSELARPTPSSGGIDRVVIFIDDLDRCEPRDVVRILEAVNLLFGFEMFVVVVAVDSRWLLRSLDQEFSAAFQDDEPGAPTPQNYLEKIIQIPFWLQPMRADGFGRLVERLSRPATRQASEDDEDKDGDNDGPGGHDGHVGHVGHDGHDGEEGVRLDDSAGPAQRTPQPAPEPQPEDEVTLELRPEERLFMQGFVGLMQTPRAAKRFLNTYQLLRVSVYDVDRFVESEDYKQVLILLALMTGTAPLTDEMVHDLAGISEPTLAGFLSSRSEPEWRSVARACTDLPVDLLTQDLVRDWLPRVARYSFHPLDR